MLAGNRSGFRAREPDGRRNLAVIAEETWRINGQYGGCAGLRVDGGDGAARTSWQEVSRGCAGAASFPSDP